MSTNSPAVSNSPSIWRRFRPLSITWVSPAVRGLPGRSTRFRKPSLEACIELLEFVVGGGLDLLVEGVAVGVDADGERAEVFDPEPPEALGHQLFPGDLFDLFDLGRLERGRAADDREVDHPEPPHRLDRLVRETTLAADRPHPVLRAQGFGEPDHPRRGGRADTDLLVPARADLPDVRGRVQEERARQDHRRRDTLVEDPDLRPVTDPDDPPLHHHLIPRPKLQD